MHRPIARSESARLLLPLQNNMKKRIAKRNELLYYVLCNDKRQSITNICTLLLVQMNNEKLCVL